MLLNPEPHESKGNISSLEYLYPFGRNDTSLDVKEALNRLNEVIEEERSSRFKDVAVIGIPSSGKTALYEMAIASMQAQGVHIISGEHSEEEIQEKLKAALLSYHVPSNLEAPEDYTLVSPEPVYTSMGNKCRIKDTTKSLAKRRTKNKIAKKSKQRNRK